MLIAAALLGAAAGCDRASGENSSDPAVATRAVAKRFAQAMTTGDEVALRETSFGDDATLRLLAAQARVNAAHDRLTSAASAKFGTADDVLPVQRGQDHYANFLEKIDEAPVAFGEGETAIVGTFPARLLLKKADGRWKVDRSRHVPPDQQLEGPERLANGLAGAYAAVADDIQAGKLQTAAEAKMSLMARTMDVVTAEGGATGALTRPATRPTVVPPQHVE